MNSEFDKEAEATNPDFMDLFGVEVTYTPKGGEAETITAILDRPEADILNDELGETTIYRRRIKILASDIASPAVGDIITEGTDDWLIYDPPIYSADLWILQGKKLTIDARQHETRVKKMQ